MTQRTHPLLAIFLKITVLVAIGIVALIVAAFLLKILLLAAIVAAVVVAGVFLYSLFRRRPQLPSPR